MIYKPSAKREFSQEEEKLLEYCKKFSYQELKKRLNDFEDNSTDEVKYKLSIILERELVNDYFEQIIQLNKDIQEVEKSAIHSCKYKIKLIKKKEHELAYYKVTKIKNVKSNGIWSSQEIFLMEDSNELIEKLKTDFKNTFSEPIVFDGLFKTNIVYGKLCGFIGKEPNYRIKLKQLLEDKDTKTLIQWLKSTTVEIQLYAIEGILTLKKAGLKFDKAVLDLINIIEKKKGTAYTCDGCMHWNDPISDIVKRIKESFNNKIPRVNTKNDMEIPAFLRKFIS